MHRLPNRFERIARLLAATFLFVGSSLAIPLITKQPGIVVDRIGEVSSLAVEATGASPLSYQWWYAPPFSPISPIPGETNSTYTPAQVPTFFDVIVEIMDSNGSVFSEKGRVDWQPQIAITNTSRWPEYRTGDAQASVIRGNFAYVAAGQIQVYNISNPRDPVRVGWSAEDVYAGRDPASLRLEGSMLYGIDAHGLLTAYDLTDPLRPRPSGPPQYTGAMALPHPVFDVEGAYAFVRGFGGLVILDISRPEISVLATNRTSDVVRMIEVANDVAYLAEGSALEMIDVSSKRYPTKLGTYGNHGHSLAISSNLLYLAGNGLEILDISQPAQPIRVGWHSAPSSNETRLSSITVQDGKAFVSCGTDGLWIFDVSDPTTPKLINRFQNGGEAWNTVSVGNFAFLANGSRGWQVLDLSNLPLVSVAETTDASATINRIECRSNLVYAAAMSAGVQVLDVSDPVTPIHLARYKTLGNANSVVLTNNLLYVASGDAGLEIVNVENPTAPQRVHRLSLGSGKAEEVYITAGRLLVRVENVLYVLDISNNLVPAVLGYYYSSGPLTRMQAKDNFVFLSDGSVIRIAENGTPSLAARVASDPFGRLALSVDHNRLLIGNMLYDISDLPQMRILTESIEGAHLNGDFLFSFDSPNRTLIKDLSTPQQPALVANRDILGAHWIRQMIKTQNRFYAAAGGGGLLILDIESGPPNIVLQPGTNIATITSVVRGTALQVKAAGEQPLHYQWYIGESGDTSRPITGATNNNLVVFVTESDVQSTHGHFGNRWVRVWNNIGTTNSATACVFFQPQLRVRGLGTIEWNSPGGRWLLEQSSDMLDWTQFTEPLNTVVEAQYAFPAGIFSAPKKFFRLRRLE